MFVGTVGEGESGMSSESGTDIYTLCVCRPSCFSRARLFETLWTIAHQAPCPWDSPGKNTGVGCHALLQGFPDPGIEPTTPATLVLQADSLLLSHQASPIYTLPCVR